MTGVDTNVLVDYLVGQQAGHARARAWLDGGEGPLATTAINVGEVLRLLSHPRVFARPTTLAVAVEAVASLLDQRAIRLLDESPEWLKDLRTLAENHASLRGNEVFDARIALCLRWHGVRRICTHDQDFDKYGFLERVVP